MGLFSPIQLLIPLLVLAVGLSFWGWMFRDMVTNDEMPREIKETWTFLFILLNVFAAAIYYGAIYRNRR
ncbi:MAG TPA: hypothetical protein VHR15_08295 [Ktedonobacterales bacterium]|jgi:hypothetical protein|nr:hypothetical protein [Ktedonobacterales bacterium]